MAVRTANPGGSSAANPFGGGGGVSQPSGSTALTMQYRVELPNGQVVSVATQAEVDALRANYQQPTTIRIGGGSSNSSSGGNSWRTAAEGAETVAAFLAGRNLRDRVEDADDARTRLTAALTRIEGLRGTTGLTDLVPALLSAFDAQRDLDDAQTDALDAQITAVDIQTGAGAVKIVSQFASGDMSGFGGGSALPIAAGAIGVGLLVTNNRDRRSRR